MVQSTNATQTAGKPIPEALRPVLISIGRGLGTVSVYGKDHPSVQQIVEQAFSELSTVLKVKKSFSLGTFNGGLTVDEEPMEVRDVPIRTLEKRLVSMKISHLALTSGLTVNELKNLLAALCAPNDEKMKQTLESAGTSHVKMEDVKYVALHGDEKKSGGSGGGDQANKDTGTHSIDAVPSVQVNQIVAFLKGESGAADGAEDVKELLSDPEKLGQMILEAASIRQSGVAVHDGESLADIVVGCLRRTYGGLRKESEFQTAQGKVNLNKAMMLLEKTVLDKIHAALGAQHPEIDKRIFDAIREMEEEQQFEMLTAHYFDQRRKIDRVEDKIVENIRKQGAEKAREQLSAMNIDPKDWKRLMIRAGADADSPSAGNGGTGSGGLDMGALAVVLEKLEGLMQIDTEDPVQVKTAVNVSRSGIKNYADRIETRIEELEGQVELHERRSSTVEDHAHHLDREQLMLEVSKLTLSLLQPLTVVNAAIEAALRHAEKEVQKDLLQLANESGRRMQALTKRLMTLVGYPTLGGK